MDNVVGLSREHALHIMMHVAQDDSISLATGTILGLSAEGLDLKTLQHGRGNLDATRVTEDGTGFGRALADCRAMVTTNETDLLQCTLRDMVRGVAHDF